MHAYRQLYIEQNPEAIRTERFNGRDHVVVPAIVLVEGVLHGANSEFPELALAEEFGKFPETWNGRPVTLSHPMRQGQFVSASSAPEVFESEAVGMVFNSRVEDGKLKVEFFLDPEKAGQDEIDRLTSGSTAEVSTGFFADVLEAKGNFKGRDFAGILTGIRPDHIALLSEEEIGACSVADGCGAPRINKFKVNRQGKMEVETVTLSRISVLAEARTPKFDGTEIAEWSTPGLGDYKAAFDGSCEFQTLADAPEGFKNFVAGHSLLGDAEGATLREVGFFPVVRPGTGKLNEGALRTVLGGRGSQANIPQEAKDSAQVKARILLGSEFGKGEKTMETGEVETCGKKLLDNGKNVAQDAPDVAGDGNFISTLAAKVKRLLQREDNDMDKAELVNQVITSKATVFTASDAEVLEAFSDARLIELAATEASGPAEGEGEASVKDETSVKGATLDAFTASDAFEALPEEVQAHLTRTMEAEKSETEALVTELAAETTVLLEEDILRTKFGLDELRALKAKVQEAKPAEDYSGKGGPQANSGEDKVYTAPETGRIWKFKTAQGE